MTQGQSNDNNTARNAWEINPPQDPYLNKTFDGRYLITKLLGRGGMGAVYQARHLSLDKFVAVKVMHDDLMADTKIVQRFKREVSAMSTLAHPNLITIQDVGSTDHGTPYFVMEYLECVSLDGLLKREVILGPERAIPIILQMTDALAHAHEKGIVHRDLKPANILILESESRDFVKVVDLGIAKLIGPADGSDMQQLTATGEAFGSPLYMSPEQVLGKPQDERTDIYALGCVMFEMLVSVPPMLKPSAISTMNAHVTEPAPRFTKAMPELPMDSELQRLEAIVLKCLEKEPANRFQSMRELMHAVGADIPMDSGKYAMVRGSSQSGVQSYPGMNTGAQSGMYTGGQPDMNTAPPGMNTGAPGMNTGVPGMNTGAPGMNTGAQPGMNTGAQHTGSQSGQNTGGQPGAQTGGYTGDQGPGIRRQVNRIVEPPPEYLERTGQRPGGAGGGGRGRERSGRDLTRGSNEQLPAHSGVDLDGKRTFKIDDKTLILGAIVGLVVIVVVSITLFLITFNTGQHLGGQQPGSQNLSSSAGLDSQYRIFEVDYPEYRGDRTNLRVLSVYNGHSEQTGTNVVNGTIDVAVHQEGKPIVLVLNAYMPTTWNIKKASDRVKINKVITVGYHPQKVVGVSGVPQVDVYYEFFNADGSKSEKRTHKNAFDPFYFLYMQGDDVPGESKFDEMKKEIEKYTGSHIRSFQGTRSTRSFTVR